MKRTILYYALVGAAILIGFNLVTLAIFGVPDADSFATGEVIGYSVIVVSLITVFLGMRSYRASAGPAAFSFGKAVLIGLGITLGPALAFGLYNLVYVVWIDPEFGDKYTAYLLDQARDTMSSAALQEYAAELQAQQAMWENPWMMMLVMFATVFLIGAVITLLSAIVLRMRKAASPAT